MLLLLATRGGGRGKGSEDKQGGQAQGAEDPRAWESHCGSWEKRCCASRGPGSRCSGGTFTRLGKPDCDQRLSPGAAGPGGGLILRCLTQQSQPCLGSGKGQKPWFSPLSPPQFSTFSKSRWQISISFKPTSFASDLKEGVLNLLIFSNSYVCYHPLPTCAWPFLQNWECLFYILVG